MSLNNNDLFIIERNNKFFKVPSSVLNDSYQKNAFVGEFPPPGIEEDGSLWWSTIDGQLYIYYDDGDSSQWVSASPASEGISDAPSDGNVYGRQDSTWVPVSAGGGGGGISYNFIKPLKQDGANVKIDLVLLNNA